MQPQIGAPLSTPTQPGRAAKWVSGLFPLLVVVLVVVQYELMWTDETGPSMAALYWIMPVLLLLSVVVVGMQFARLPWKQLGVMLYAIPIALVFTGAVFFATHYSLDWRFGVSANSRTQDEIETHARGVITNEWNNHNGVLPIKKATFDGKPVSAVDMDALGYNECYKVEPGAKHVDCAHLFTAVKQGNDIIVTMVDKAPWVNPFDKHAGAADYLFWLLVAVGSWLAFNSYVAFLPGPLPEHS